MKNAEWTGGGREGLKAAAERESRSEESGARREERRSEGGALGIFDFGLPICDWAEERLAEDLRMKGE
jgi:hypothetical protein